MNFSKEDRAAIYSVAQALCMADFRFDEKEQHFFYEKLREIGLTKDEEVEFEEDFMEPSVAVPQIAGFSDEKKEFVMAFLFILMAVDGEISDQEKAFLALTARFCGLPTEMSIVDAILYFQR